MGRVVSGALVGAACLAAAMPARAGDEARPPAPDGAGMVIYIDPSTGGFSKEPAPGAAPLRLTPSLQNALATSSHGLVEAPSPVPGGGVLLDLQGRFQSPVLATVDGGGAIKTHHLDDAAAPGGKK